jgi:uncharacterized protein
MKMIFPVWFTLVVFLLSTGTSWSAKPDKRQNCFKFTEYMHLAVKGKCSSAFETGDYETALSEWKPFAEQGDANAQSNLGWMYYLEQGVPASNKTALMWFKLSAEQGHADAQFGLGMMYANGDGIPQDDKTALKWYRLSAEQGHAFAQHALGEMFEKGEVVPQDGETALKWYKLSAEQGLSYAQFALGEMFEKGEIVPQDDETALKWYELVAKSDDDHHRELAEKKLPSLRKKIIVQKEQDADAQYRLALRYKNGDGVEKNLSTALSWARKAHQQGHSEAGKLHGHLILQDFLFAGDVRELDTLSKVVKKSCKGNMKCSFDKVWAYLDITGDGFLSLAEIARFQRNIIKYSAANQEDTKLETEDFAAINLATIIFLPITASAIVHSFDYDNDGLLSKNEVFRETEFAKLAHIIHDRDQL